VRKSWQVDVGAEILSAPAALPGYVLLYSFSAANAKRMFFTPKPGCFCPAGDATVRRLYADFGRRHVRAVPPGSSSCNPGYSSSTFPCCSGRSLGILNRRPTFAGDSLPGGAVDTPRRHKRAGRGEIGMFGIPAHNTDRSLFSWKQRAGILEVLPECAIRCGGPQFPLGATRRSAKRAFRVCRPSAIAAEGRSLKTVYYRGRQAQRGGVGGVNAAGGPLSSRRNGGMSGGR
jgi:hypothetical protein